MVGGSASSQGNSGDRKQSSYKLKSLSELSSSRKKKGPKELYPTDTIDLVGQGSVERILPPARIQKKVEVDISRHDQTPWSESLGAPMDQFGEV